MGIEIEHKYLVVNQDYLHMAEECLEIRQGYLSRDPARTVRVRTLNGKGFLTIKGKNKGAQRLEFEYEIPYSEALQLLSMCLPGILEKKRYIVPFKGFIWEIDEFSKTNSGLVIAEIELPDSDISYPLPSFVGENVTGNPIYYNSNL